MRTLFEDVARDLRHAWRRLRRTHGFSVAAVLGVIALVPVHRATQINPLDAVRGL